MFLVYIGIYILFLAFIWGFFMVAKLHSYKFRNFSTHIQPVTIFLFFFLLILSILGFILIFFLETPFASVLRVEPIKQTQQEQKMQENYY